MATEDIIVQSSSPLNGYLKEYHLTPAEPVVDPAVFLTFCEHQQTEIIKECMSRMGPIILWQSVHVNMVKLDGSFTTAAFHHRRQHVFPETSNVEKILSRVRGAMLNNCDIYVEKGSGWMVESVDHLDVHINPYNPFTGSCWVALPKEVKMKKAVLNIKNKDSK